MNPSPQPSRPAMSRARFLRLAAGAAGAAALAAAGSRRVHAAAAAATPVKAPPASPMLSRPIPATGEKLPVIGLGTWQAFDVAPGSAEFQRLPAVVQTLFDAGGSVIDSSPMYGRAETVTGELLASAGSRQQAFLATKVWTRGRAEGVRQMSDSLRLLQTESIDLMQVHNLLDWHNHYGTLREWKAAGRIRYLGVTHYTSGAYDELAAAMHSERFDFVQVNYSLDEREAELRILPLAAERGMAVLINRPFGGGGLLRRLRDRPLPPWAAEIGAGSWAQLLLKFVLAQPAVTCVIPGTGRAEHMADNAAAGRGPLPDPAFWRRHRELFDL